MNRLDYDSIIDFRRTWMRRILFFCALFCFCWIAFIVSAKGITSLDSWLCAKVYAIRSPGLTTALTAVTYTANWQTITLICILLLFFSKSRRAIGIPVTLSAISSTLCYEVLKRVFERPRPDTSLHLITQGGYSFPSGHSMTGLVFYGVLILLVCRHVPLAWLRRLLSALLTLWILLIGFSRIYLGVHYPTDVLGGWSLGLCVVCAFSIELHRRWAARSRYSY